MDVSDIIFYSVSAVLGAYVVATLILLIFVITGCCKLGFKKKKSANDCEEAIPKEKFNEADLKEMLKENSKLEEEVMLGKQKQEVAVEWFIEAEVENSRLQDEFKSKEDAIKRSHEAEVKQRKAQLEKERLEKEDALKRLSAIMSSRLKDGNPNVVDLSDQNRPNKLGEQFSELYDNQWTDAYGVIENFFANTKDESEIIRILLDILEQCFKECKTISKYQLDQLQSNVANITSIITKKNDSLPTDLMQIVKSDRKCLALDEVPELDVMLPRLRSNFSAKYLDQNFLDEQVLKIFIKECIKLSWLMVIQDPPMAILLKPDSDAYQNFKAYKTRGELINYVVWPALLLEEGGPLVLKGVAEFTSVSTDATTWL